MQKKEMQIAARLRTEPLYDEKYEAQRCASYLGRSLMPSKLGYPLLDIRLNSVESNEAYCISWLLAKNKNKFYFQAGNCSIRDIAKEVEGWIVRAQKNARRS